MNHRRRSWQPWFVERLAWRGSRIRGNHSEDEPHPLQHITALQCHEWMLRDCAALELARQQREDGVITTVTNISSGALLAIPGLLFSKGLELPPFFDNQALYIGFTCFGIALASAITEQIMSRAAYKRQADISKAYHRLESTIQSDIKSVGRVEFTRNSSILFFAAALLLSAYGLTQLRSTNHGQSTVTPASTTTTTTTTTPAAATTTPAAAAPAASPK